MLSGDMSEDTNIYSKIDDCESPIPDIMDAHQTPPRIKMTVWYLANAVWPPFASRVEYEPKPISWLKKYGNDRS